MSERVAMGQPAHLGFPGIWQFKNGPDTGLFYYYRTWVANDEKRLDSVVENMQWFPPGFHGLLVGRTIPSGAVTPSETLQLNFYDARYPGTEDPHAHSRDAFSSWHAPRGTHQILTRYQIVQDKAAELRGLPIEEREVVAMNIGDHGDGSRPKYMPTKLGKGLVLPRSGTRVGSLGSQWFSSTEVHHAGFAGEGVAV